MKNLGSIKGLQILNLNFTKNHQHIFPIRILNGKRDALKKFLEKRDIQTGIHYQPNHLLTKYRSSYRLRNSEIFGEEILSIPLHPDLSKKDVSKVVFTIRQFLSEE